MLCLDLTQVICKEINDNSDDKLKDKQVCEVMGTDDHKCTCFTISNLEDEMIQNFIIFGQYNGGLNKIFEYCWDQQVILSGIKHNTDVSFNSVYNLVWKKTIVQCKLLLSKLNDKSVTLKEVENLYHLFICKDKTSNGNEMQCLLKSLSPQLSALCNAIHQCYPSSTESFLLSNEWIPQMVEHIAYYHEVVNDSKCIEAAVVIMKVKKSLKLEKEFKIVEDFANCVSFYS